MVRNPNPFSTLSRLQSFDDDDDELWAKPPKSSSTEGYELDLVVDWSPESAHPPLLSSVLDVAHARSLLRALGDRPDHEAVEYARALISKVADGNDKAAALRAVVELDELHDAYERLLKGAEEKLERMCEGLDSEPEEEEEESEEVMAMLGGGFEKGVERADLSGREIRVLPDVFGNLGSLVALDMSSNILKVIPDTISGLKCLEELRISSNNLIMLPDSIGSLSNLKVLDLSRNKLKSLPDSISSCRSLIELNASYNDLTYLPTNIGHGLHNLERLFIQLNKIRFLPTSICEMRSLCLFDAHFNELRGLPNAIGKLKNLEVLNISNNFNDLQELPGSFGDLVNLQAVDLSNNQIHVLPDSFGRLDKLIKLDLEQNPLVVPPVEVVNDGVEAVKEYMRKRWVDILLADKRKSTQEEHIDVWDGWKTQNTSLLNSWVSGVSGSVLRVTEARSTSFKDPYLDREL